MWGTLRVVTARKLIVLSGSFTSHSKSARRLRHFTWSCEPREVHSLRCWRVRNKSPQAYPTCTRDWTHAGPPHDRHTRYHLRYCNPPWQHITYPSPRRPPLYKDQFWLGHYCWQGHNAVYMPLLGRLQHAHTLQGAILMSKLFKRKEDS